MSIPNRLFFLLLTACALTDRAAPHRAGDTPSRPANLPRAVVVAVIDGDTLDVELNGQVERLRLIGLDTPETVHPNRPVECFGKEASAKAKERLNGQTVYLEEDTSQDSRDRYGRLLRYVWLEDGALYNLAMIAEGYVFIPTNAPMPISESFSRRSATRRLRSVGSGPPLPVTAYSVRQRTPASLPRWRVTVGWPGVPACRTAKAHKRNIANLRRTPGARAVISAGTWCS